LAAILGVTVMVLECAPKVIHTKAVIHRSADATTRLSQSHRRATVRAKLCVVGAKYSGGIVAIVHGTRELLKTTGSERGEAGLVPLAYDNVHTINNSVRQARYVG
jgi:hypothetical protein